MDQYILEGARERGLRMLDSQLRIRLRCWMNCRRRLELVIPTNQMGVIHALAEAHTSRDIDHTFDDFFFWKGLGLIILLQICSSPRPINERIGPEENMAV